MYQQFYKVNQLYHTVDMGLVIKNHSDTISNIIERSRFDGSNV